MTRCQAVAKGGKPCPQRALPDGNYCYMHDPALAKERSEARRRGGLNKRVQKASDVDRPARLRSVEDVLRLLEETLADTRLLENGANRSKVFVSIALAALRALEVGQLEERLEALEQRLAELDERRLAA
jgi:hypothetical protein